VKNHQKVIHSEIAAKDTKCEKTFYQKAFHWKFDKYGGEGMDYWLATTAHEKEIGINDAISMRDETHPMTATPSA